MRCSEPQRILRSTVSGRVPIELVTFEAQRFSPLALGYLHARLEGDPKLRDAVDIRINVASANDDPRGVAEAIIARGPAVVGLSVYVWNARQSYELARLIRTALPQAVIIAGGPEVGPQPTEVLEAQAALDVVVLGEGEGPFGDMVGALLRGEGFAGIPGLAIRDDAGGIVLTADRPPAPSLADLPSPFQLGTLPPRDGETACIETHRGCTFACRFCYYHKAFGATRLLEEDRVRADLRILLDSIQNAPLLGGLHQRRGVTCRDTRPLHGLLSRSVLARVRNVVDELVHDLPASCVIQILFQDLPGRKNGQFPHLVP